MEKIKTFVTFLQIEILEIISKEEAGEPPYSSSIDAYYPVLVKWRQHTVTPRIILEELDFTISTLYIADCAKIEITTGLYQKIPSESSNINCVFKKISKQLDKKVA